MPWTPFTIQGSIHTDTPDLGITRLAYRLSDDTRITIKKIMVGDTTEINP